MEKDGDSEEDNDEEVVRKIALSLKSVFPILSSYLLIRSHSMFMLALVITIIIVDTLFRPHLTIMSSTMVLHTHFSPILIFLPRKYTEFSPRKNEYILRFPPPKNEHILNFPLGKPSMSM
jgi:hypothetical protein